MAFTKQAIFLLLLALLALSTFANPLEDVSNTSVDLGVTDDVSNPNTEHLTVKITRVDDLITKEGDLIAERQVAIEIVFDVVDDTVCINGNPLSPGISSITLTGAIIASPETIASSNDETIPQSADDLAEAFDVGIVTIEVATVVEYAVAEDGITPIRRITVTERVIEVEGATVIETDVRQQVLEIALDGTGGIRKFEPIAAEVDASVIETALLEPATLTEEQLAGLLGEPEIIPCGGSSPLERFKAWWTSLSVRQRTLISFFTSFWLTFSFLLVALAVSRAKRCSRLDGYALPCEQLMEESKLDTVEVLLFEEQDAEDVMDEKKGLLA